MTETTARIPMSGTPGRIAFPSWNALAFSFLLAIASAASAQSIFTVVGGGGESIDGGPATAAILRMGTWPYLGSIKLGPDGSLYIAETGNHLVRKVELSTGIIRTVAGTQVAGFSGDGGPATKAKLSSPQDIAIDRDGNVYIADTINHRIRRVDARSGVITSIATLSYPVWITVDSHGDLLVVQNFIGCRLWKISAPGGTPTVIAGTGNLPYAGDGGPASSANLAYVSGLAIDTLGNIYLSDSTNVRRIDAVTGIISLFAGNGTYESPVIGTPATQAGIRYPGALAFDSRGRLYVVSETSVWVIDTTASPSVFSSSLCICPCASSGESGESVTVSATGLVYFTQYSHDSGYSQIFYRGSSGVCDTYNRVLVAGSAGRLAGDDGPATAATLNAPMHPAVDEAGNILFSDSGNFVVRRIDRTTGIIKRVAGNGTEGFTGDGGPATLASLGEPVGIAAEPSGDVFVSDTGWGGAPNRILRLKAGSGRIETVAGGWEVGMTGDGGPAADARIAPPTPLALDPAAGSLYLGNGGSGGGDRLRSINLKTGVISSLVGPDAFSGDGGPATAADVIQPSSVALDSGGSLYIPVDNKVRRVDAVTGVITTVAGGGVYNYYDNGDGGPATAASLEAHAVAVDSKGNLYIAEAVGSRVRKVDVSTKIITTFAGSERNCTGSDSVGDGGLATSADLCYPSSLVFDRSDNLYIYSMARVRRVDTRGMITTVAGNGKAGFSGDGGPAVLASIGSSNPQAGLALDGSGNLYLAEYPRIRKVTAATGQINTVAGGGTVWDGSADGGPATLAGFRPDGLAVDGAGNMYIGTVSGVRYVPASTGIINTIAGGYGLDYAFAGDGGPATRAGLSSSGVAIDGAGNLYIADSANDRIRRVSAGTGVISTVAGKGVAEGPGRLVRLGPMYDIALDSTGRVLIAAGDTNDLARGVIRRFDPKSGLVERIRTSSKTYSVSRVSALPDGKILYFDKPDSYSNQLFRLDPGTGKATLLAGSLTTGFDGDGGPASGAIFSSKVGGLAVDKSGAIFIADTGNNRIRVINACDGGGPFAPTFPEDGAEVTEAAVNLGWAKSDGATGYDVLVDTEFPPRFVAAAGVTASSTLVGGLTPGATYYWQVSSRNDPYCPSDSGTRATLRRFRVANPCSAPSPSTPKTPAIPGSTTQLTWDAPPNSVAFDVYLGTGPSQPLVAKGLTSPSYTATSLSAGAMYHWRVVAHAACNPNLTSSSALASFVVPGECSSPAPQVLSPAVGEENVPESTRLSWRPAPGAVAYDIYLGVDEGGTPPLFAEGVIGASLEVSLERGRKYSWKVAARSGCDPSKVAFGDAGSFSTGCRPPAAPAGTAVDSRQAATGALYSFSWYTPEKSARFVVERSRTSAFSAPEVFVTPLTSIALTALSPGTYYHRVRAQTTCGTSSPSEPVTISVATAPASIVFLRSPAATITALASLGTALPAITFELANIGASDFVGFFNTSQTVPFFQLSEAVVALRPGERKTYGIQFISVPVHVAGQYEGILSLSASGHSAAPALPQATVSLTVGSKVPDGLSSRAPVFEVGDQEVDAVAFHAAAATSSPGDITVSIRNTGQAPLDLTGEVAPDPWFAPQPGWNATPLAAGERRSVTLQAQRIRGGAGGGFPRYAYFTVRTVDGKSSRLLVRDDVFVPAGPCPGRAPLEASESSLIVPSVANVSGRGGVRFVSKVLVTNLGGEPAQVDLYYTPDAGDPSISGFDCAKVSFVSLVVPGNDVVALTDPVGQIFGLTQSSGQLEVRSSQIGQIRVQSSVDAPAAGGGSFGFQLPVVRYGEGARPNVPYAVMGAMQSDVYRTNLILSETSGQPASVTVTLYDRSGKALGSTQRDLPPYSKQQFSTTELTPAGAPFSAGALEIVPNEGSAGSVAGIITVIDGRTGDASCFLARPLTNATTSNSYAVPSVVVSNTFKSRVEIRNNDTKPVTYTLRYMGSTGELASAPRTLNPKAEDTWDSVLEEVFDLTPTSFGPLFIDSNSPHLSIVSRVYSEQPSGSYGDAIEGYATDDPTTTGESGRVILTDGLEGTAGNDKSRGARSNLIMTEIGGGSAELEVSAWEKTQARVAPVGTLTVKLGPNEQRQINDIFGNDGFGIGSKDRLNVMCTIRPKPGSTGKVVALVTRIDNKTQDTKNLVLRP